MLIGCYSSDVSAYIDRLIYINQLENIDTIINHSLLQNLGSILTVTNESVTILQYLWRSWERWAFVCQNDVYMSPLPVDV